MTDLNEDTKTLATIQRHRDQVRSEIKRVIYDLEQRAIVHDSSKLSIDELSGFVQFQRVAREHPIGTPEYEASLRSNDTLDKHFAANSHHPEHHDGTENMGWLDIIEMVCDWCAASKTYGRNSMRESLDYHRKRHGFKDEQWWLIMQIVDYLEPKQ